MDPVRTSKFLSLVLRHKPETVGIELDESGWVDVDLLLAACRQHGVEITPSQLRDVVEANDKKRFVIRDGRIRANQGHSLPVDLGLRPVSPPNTLFHGTAEKNRQSIEKHGLIRQNRQHVHLSPDKETASRVGRRHGKPVIFEVLAGEMVDHGHRFYQSENGVWLADAVPPQFLRKLQDAT